MSVPGSPAERRRSASMADPRPRSCAGGTSAPSRRSPCCWSRWRSCCTDSLGPQVAATNLSTLLIWIYYRGLLIGALLVGREPLLRGVSDDPGARPRRGASTSRRITGHDGWAGNRWRSRCSSRSSSSTSCSTSGLVPTRPPGWWSAYFAAAVLVDTTFRGAAFCKHVCPVGQFNFVASTLSPLEVRIRARTVCQTCTTVDCIKGRRDPAEPSIVLQRGCELALFQPTKIGNLDCTFCLDCVHACPHDNVAIGFRVPGEELADDRRRSSIGRLSRRPDLARSCWCSRSARCSMRSR